MKNRIDLSPHDFLVWEHTPWDERIFKKKTAQIIDFKFITEKNGKELLDAFESDSNAKLIYGRFISSDLLIKKVFIDKGYFSAETSLQVFLPSLQKYDLSPMYRKRLRTVTSIPTEKLDKVATVAYKMFDFSRFHEDPYIEKDLANLRIKNWVLDMKNQNVHTLINGDDNNIRSFMIYKVNEKKAAELILGGCIESERMNAPFFWASVIEQLKSEGVTKISTTISAANSGVLSLYLGLGFGISATSSDYHKHK